MECRLSGLSSVRVSMGSFLMTALVCFFNGFYCFENLSKRNTTILDQSSTHRGQGESFANDGNLDLKFAHCSHTDFNRSRAWLQVDLGKPYSISNVQIYYRSEDSWKQYRFRQFYLDVSEFPATTSTTSQRTRCYTDNTTYPNLPPNIIDISCRQTARYVIVETTYVAPESYPLKGAILEICEIEIYGCETGKYGDDCRPCVGCQSCNIQNGRCVPHSQNRSRQHFLYAFFLLFCLSLMINIFFSIRCVKNSICKSKREQPKQNEKRLQQSTNEDFVEMETDYITLSELCRSQHYYEQVR